MNSIVLSLQHNTMLLMLWKKVNRPMTIYTNLVAESSVKSWLLLALVKKNSFLLWKLKIQHCVPNKLPLPNWLSQSKYYFFMIYSFPLLFNQSWTMFLYLAEDCVKVTWMNVANVDSSWEMVESSWNPWCSPPSSLQSACDSCLCSLNQRWNSHLPLQVGCDTKAQIQYWKSDTLGEFMMTEHNC